MPNDTCLRCDSGNLVVDPTDDEMLICLECYERLPRESELIANSIDVATITNPPAGAWFREENDSIQFGVKIRVLNGFFLLLFGVAALALGLLCFLGPLWEGRIEVFLLSLGGGMMFVGALASYFALFYLFAEHNILIQGGELIHYVGMFGKGSTDCRKLSEITNIYQDFYYSGSGRNYGRVYRIVVDG